MKSFVQVTVKRNVKGIILLLILCFGVICTLIVGVQMPYHAYRVFLDEGIHGRLINEPAPSQKLLSSKLVNIPQEFSLDSNKLWKDLEFSNFALPLPIRHPVFNVMPRPYITSGTSIPRVDYFGGGPQKLLSFIPTGTSKGNFSFPSDKLFKLPLVRKYILRKGRTKIWSDIFTKDLNFRPAPLYQVTAFFKMVKKVSPLEVAYYFYLYKLRKRLFPANAIAANIINGSHVIFEIERENRDEKQNYYLGKILNAGKFYTYKIDVEKNNSYSDLVIKRLMKSIRVIPSRGRETMEKLYALYRSLTYKERVSQSGLIYLYSAWTHDLENPTILREAIQFMERGKDNENLLQPLYKFSLEKWGTSFSSKDKFLEEDARNRLLRNIEKERQLEEDEMSDFEVQDTFKTSLERIKYKLKRAKLKTQKRSESVLIED